MNPEAQKALLFELGDTLLRSWWTIVAGICLGLTGSMVMLHKTPNEYEATATILIAPQKIPKEFLESTVTDDISRRMAALERAVINDDYMLELIDQYYERPEKPWQVRSLIQRLRSKISIQPQESLRGWVAFDLTFRDREAKRSADAANMLAELYVRQNTDFRTAQARQTLETIEVRLAAAKEEFELKDREMNEFNALHSFETEGHLDTNLRLLENARRDFETRENSLSLARQQLGELENELAEYGTGTTLERQVRQMQQELDDLLVNYSAVHPDVVKKRRALEDLLATGDRDSGAERRSSAPESPEVAALDEQIERVNLEIAGLTNARNGLRRQIAEYERRIRAVPEVQPRLTELANEYTMLRQRHRELEDKADKAREALFLEESQQGVQFELADRARTPRDSVFPNPRSFYALGLVGGLMLFVGPLLTYRFVNPLIHSEAGVRAISEVPVLVVIPRILTPRNRRYKVRRFMVNAAISIVFVGGVTFSYVYLNFIR